MPTGPDWVCQHCWKKTFARKTECFHCGEPRDTAELTDPDRLEEWRRYCREVQLDRAAEDVRAQFAGQGMHPDEVGIMSLTAASNLLKGLAAKGSKSGKGGGKGSKGQLAVASAVGSDARREEEELLWSQEEVQDLEEPQEDDGQEDAKEESEDSNWMEDGRLRKRQKTEPKQEPEAAPAEPAAAAASTRGPPRRSDHEVPRRRVIVSPIAVLYNNDGTFRGHIVVYR